MSGRLFLFDTSNFVDFPIGGQLTSIHNFLRYVCENYPERAGHIVLVGLTLVPEEVGRLKKLRMFGTELYYYPVMLGEADLNNTKRSIRLQYVKGLWKYIGKLKPGKGDCCYINTPEAYGPVRLKSRGASFVAFTHCNYFDMIKSVRFYSDRKLVLYGFDRYLRHVVRHVDLIFALSTAAEKAYRDLGGNCVRVCNSIVCNDDTGRRRTSSGHRMIYVGRISANKGIETIIKAVSGMVDAYTLTIVGEGEDYQRLKHYAGDRVRFTGVVTPQRALELIQEADILIMNSGYEGMPMTILEAQSFGLPVVTTNVGGIGEAVNFGQDAEETDGSEGAIQEAIMLIEADYGRYSAAALANAWRFDYRVVNKTVYDELSGYWK